MKGGIPLLTVRVPACRLEDVVLSRENLAAVNRILNEHPPGGKCLRPTACVLATEFYSVARPAVEKTLTAEVIAGGNWGRPIAVIRNGQASSRRSWGETAANLRKVFDFVASSPLVALFDEFDALGKEREGRDGTRGNCAVS